MNLPRRGVANGHRCSQMVCTHIVSMQGLHDTSYHTVSHRAPENIYDMKLSYRPNACNKQNQV